jgi:hypothetical protein
MSDVEGKIRWIQVLSFVSVVALFIADYAFGIMAKEPPLWAYLVPGLLALGIEARAVGRMLMQIVRGVAKSNKEDELQ